MKSIETSNELTPVNLYKRKRKRRQITCTCPAYSFPHRLGGGKCRLSAFASRIYNGEEGFRPKCSNCISNNNSTCEVAEEREDARYCETIVTIFNFKEDKL